MQTGNDDKYQKKKFYSISHKTEIHFQLKASDFWQHTNKLGPKIVSKIFIVQK